MLVQVVVSFARHLVWLRVPKVHSLRLMRRLREPEKRNNGRCKGNLLCRLVRTESGDWTVLLAGRLEAGNRVSSRSGR